ncbi:MAG: AAA family ATPase [Lachnospirales bacterium]
MDKIDKLISEIAKVIKGKDDVIKKVVMTIFAGGHILMEDIPGVGKTTLAVAISSAMGLSYKRIQFTPDVLPSDVVGFSMYNKKSGDFTYEEGAVMTNILLADEINRTSSKTQSALLEAMEEGKVTVDKVTRKLPEPFIVIATQNPFGSAGTQRLPQSQIERFMTRLSMGYPEREDEIEILKNSSKKNLDLIEPVFTKDEILDIKNKVYNIYTDNSVLGYIVDIAKATRNSKYILTGISPRGSVALLNMAKARSFMEGRDYVVPEDVKEVLNSTCPHRIELNNEALAKGINEEDLIREISESIKVVK